MPTLAGMRRRGYTPAAIRDFCEKIGVAKANSMIDLDLLNFCLREDLNRNSQRAMAVIRPLKVVLTNYPEDKIEEFDADNNPENPSTGTRKIPFSRELYIERDDFMEIPPKGFFRLAPGKEVRLKHAYYIKCEEVIKDASGEIAELRCTYDPESRGGGTPDGRKVKGTLHWVSAAHSVQAEVRLFSHLLLRENPDDVEEGKDFMSILNPNSLEVLKNCRLEPALAGALPGNSFQFLRQGYFCVDSKDSAAGRPVFNRIVELKDSWAKIEKKAQS
jgi:glutaminyl-tRNA synthetase